MQLQVKKLSVHATIPTKAHATDSGFDLYAAKDVYIKPGETVIVPTDIAIKLPEGYEAQIRPRSGITSKTKLRVQLGTIDNAYTGALGIIVDNISPEYFYIPRHLRDKNTSYVNLANGLTWRSFSRHEEGTYLVRKGDKIAQLVVQPVALPQLVEVSDLDETDRGESGFGSSGTR